MEFGTGERERESYSSNYWPLRLQLCSPYRAMHWYDPEAVALMEFVGGEFRPAGGGKWEISDGARHNPRQLRVQGLCANNP